MQESAAALLIIAAFIVGFPLFWMAIVFLISRLGGWASLANQYPAEGPVEGDTFHWGSARFRFFTNYGNCLNVTVSSTGIHIQPVIIFRTGHNPIFIPWNAVEDLKRNNFWLFSSTKLRIKDKFGGWQKTIILYGRRLADVLERHFQRK